MSHRIRFHGRADAIADTAQAVALYAEGNDEALTLQPADRLEVETASLTTGAGLPTLFFAESAGSPAAGSVVLASAGPGQQVHEFDPPRRGQAGQGLFVISSGPNRITASVEGWLYRA